jgi:hypothetical protein
MTAIPVTSSSGAHITGLTVGQLVGLASNSGPWHPHGGGAGDDSYTFQVSLDGSTWSSGLGTSNDPIAPQSDSYIPAWVDSRVNLDLYHVQLYFYPSQTDCYIRVFDTVFGDNTGSLDYVLSGPGVGACQYGGEADSTKTLPYVVTTAVLDAVIASALALTGQLELLPYVATAAAAIEGTIPFAVDCTVVPSAVTPLNLTDPSSLSPDNLRAWLRQAMWSWFCKCTAAPGGSPAPKPFVPPPVVVDPHAPITPPTPVSCNNTDLCSYLNHLEQLVAAIGTQVSYLRTDVRLIQRQGVPFGYLHGTAHGPLTGQGDFAVADILGLEVSFSSIPALPGHSAGDPDTYHQLGKISLGTVDGWRRSWQPTHSPYLIFPVSGAFTKVGYTFPAGVTATITELLREA